MEYPSNSQRPKDEKPETNKTKMAPVVQTAVERRKKPLGKRFKETFIGGDAKTVFGFVVASVIVPSAKDMLLDSINEGAERLIRGENAPIRSRGQKQSVNGVVNYAKAFAKGGIPEPRNQISRRSRATHNFDEIILASRVEAGAVLDRMWERIAEYDVVTVADLYELCDITGNYVDEKWGWTDIRTAGVTRVGRGYLLDLPAPEPLD